MLITGVLRLLFSSDCPHSSHVAGFHPLWSDMGGCLTAEWLDGRERLHLEQDGAGFAVAPDGGPVEGGAPFPVARCELRVQHNEQPHAVRKALVGRPVQRRPPVYVWAAQWNCTSLGAVSQD